MGKRLWEIAGLASDPGVQLTIGMAVSVVATTPAAGGVALRCMYSPAGA